MAPASLSLFESDSCARTGGGRQFLGKEGAQLGARGGCIFVASSHLLLIRGHSYASLHLHRVRVVHSEHQDQKHHDEHANGHGRDDGDDLLAGVQQFRGGARPPTGSKHGWTHGALCASVPPLVPAGENPTRAKRRGRPAGLDLRLNRPHQICEAAEKPRETTRDSWQKARGFPSQSITERALPDPEHAQRQPTRLSIDTR